MQYEPIREVSRDDAELSITRNNPDELAVVVLSVALNWDELSWAESFCFSLSVHANEFVRGNAILGLGHLARRFGRLDSPASKSAVTQALTDISEYVRGQADSAHDDLKQFLQ